MVCDGNLKKLCNNDKCKKCYERSFASHPKAKYWSDSNELTPRQVFKCSSKTILFDCQYCGHIFDTRPDRITLYNRWCPYCSNSTHRLCNDNKCKFCFNKSMASEPLSIFWSDSNTISPRFVFKTSRCKYCFDCKKCGHTFFLSPATITYDKCGCPYCTGTKICGKKDCFKCYDRSFASTPYAQYWSKKNKVSPIEIHKCSSIDFLFDCEEDHIFEMSPARITYHKQWCPFCKNKTETKMYKWFSENNYQIIYQAKYAWCIKKRKLPFDFVIEKYKLIIELDGRQHFKQVSSWDSPEITQSIDVYKMNIAMEKGYTIIRLLQEDVWRDTYDWSKLLRSHLHKYKNPQCIFLSKNNEYDVYKNLMAQYNEDDVINNSDEYEIFEFVKENIENKLIKKNENICELEIVKINGPIKNSNKYMYDYEEHEICEIIEKIRRTKNTTATKI